MTGESPLVEVSKAQPSSVIVGEQLAALPVLDRNFLVAGPAPARRRAAHRREQPVRGDQVRRPGRSAQRLHDDHRRRRRRRRHLGQPGHQHAAGRGAGVQGLPQPVRRPVRVGAQRGGQRRHQVGHQRLHRHRLLLRPRQVPERPQRQGRHRAAVSAVPRSAARSAGRSCRIAPTSSAPTSSSTSTRRRSSRCRRTIRSPPSRTATIRSTARAHVRRARRSPVQRRPVDVRPLRLRPPVHAERRPDQRRPRPSSTPARRTAWSASTTGCCHSRWSTPLRFHYLDHNLFTEPANFDLQIVRPSYTFGQNGVAPQYFPAQDRAASSTPSTSTRPRHDIKVGGEFTCASSNFEAHFTEHGAFTFTTDAPSTPQDPRDLAVHLRPADAGVLQLHVEPDCALRPGRLAHRRSLPAEPRPALRPRHQPAPERLLPRPAGQPAVRRHRAGS